MKITMKTPCETIIFSVLPAIRAKIVKGLRKKGLTQKEIAEMLDLTQPAISQYIRGKRANNFIVSQEFDKDIEEKIAMLTNNSKDPEKIYCDMCKKIRQSTGQKATCNIPAI